MASDGDEVDVDRGGRATAADPAEGRIRRWVRRIGWTVLFFVPGAVWAFASPMYSVPDEPHQAVKAVATWYGQLGGSPVEGQPSVVRTYDIPSVWATERSPAVCYAFDGTVTPDRCDDRLFAGGNDIVAVPTYDGGFPPLYYALVGWGGRASASADGVVLMRLASAALSGALLASALLALRRVLARPLALVGVLLAATPMTYFLSGAVNPNGFEVAAAIALWCHVVAIGRWRERRPDEVVPVALLAGLVVSGSALALTRFLSPVYTGLIVVLGLVAVSTPAARSLARDRPSRWAFGAVTAVALVALAAVVRSGNADGLAGTVPAEAFDPWRQVAGRSFTFVEQMIGWFGWLDTPPTNLLTWLWLGAVLALVAIAGVLGRPRQLVALAATIGAVLVVPVVVQAPSLYEHGLVWQGRHGLPLAAGIPILAVLIIDRHAAAVAGLARRVAVGAVLAAASATPTPSGGRCTATPSGSPTPASTSAGTLAAAARRLDLGGGDHGVGRARRRPRPAARAGDPDPPRTGEQHRPGVVHGRTLTRC